MNGVSCVTVTIRPDPTWYFPFIIKKKRGQYVDNYDDYGYNYRLFIAELDSVDNIQNVSEEALQNAFEDWMDEIGEQGVWDY